MSVLRALDPRFSWPGYLLAAGVVLALLFTLIEPVFSRGLSLGARLLFWTLHIGLGLLLLQVVQVAVSRLPIGHVATIPVAALLASVLFVPMGLTLDAAFPVADEIVEDALTAAVVLDEWTGVAPSFVVVWVALNAARFLRLAPGGPGTGDTPPGQPAFLAKIPFERRGALVAITAELHYLRVYTTRGEALILYGFGEALEELEGVGVRVHRSHWINPDHLERIDGPGGRQHAFMTTGLVVPVARSRRHAVAEALAEWRPLVQESSPLVHRD